MDIKLREVHQGNADGEYLSNGQRVLRIEQDTNGNDVDKSYGSRLSPREREILSQYSTDDKPVFSDDNAWQQYYKKKRYQSNPEEVIRDTRTMKDRTAFVEYNHVTNYTINDLPSIYISDDSQNGNIDFTLNPSFSSAFNGQLLSLKADGNIGNVQVTLTIYNNNGGGGGANSDRGYLHIERARGRIISQMQSYISAYLGISANNINVNVNNLSGNPANGNVVISTN